VAKLIFLLRRKSGTTREQCLSYWAGGAHTALVEKLPASDEAAQAALASTEMAQVLENSKMFLDMDRTSVVTVSEAALVG
jgi:hypothetical protein